MYMKLKHCFVPPLHHVALIPKCITWCVPWSLGWINPCPYDVLSMSWPFLPQVPFWRTEYVKTLRDLVKSLAHGKQLSLSHSRQPRFRKPFRGTGNELLFPRVSASKFCTFSCDFCLPSWLLNCLEGSGVIFWKKPRNYCFPFTNKLGWWLDIMLKMFWTESGTILEANDRSVIVTTLLGILIQIVKVKNGVVILLKLQKAAIPRVTMSQRKVTYVMQYFCSSFECIWLFERLVFVLFLLK